MGSGISKETVSINGHNVTIPHHVTSEIGFRSTQESRLKALYNRMYADPSYVASVREIREMDRRDARVKKIHVSSAQALTKPGLKLHNPNDVKWLNTLWNNFSNRLGLSNRSKLESDTRGALMEGNLAIQWVLDDNRHVVKAIRMPSETLRPNVGGNGQFIDNGAAYEQWDELVGKKIAVFPLWQMTVGRLNPDNWDDMGCYGRPLLDATRESWRKLIMTEEDLVIRRRERAPMRTVHILEGATADEILAYKQENEADQQSITTNHYLNKKGGVSALQGDANLDQIADVVHLLDTFFSGAPGPKALFGYPGDTSRDVLEDLKRDYFDRLDSHQDVISWVYEQGFRLEIMLSGRNPDSVDFGVGFAERLTTTPNQKMDMALKAGGVGVSRVTQFEIAGIDPILERKRLEAQAGDDLYDPYPSDNEINVKPRMPGTTVVEGNDKKGESQTTVKNN